MIKKIDKYMKGKLRFLYVTKLNYLAAEFYYVIRSINQLKTQVNDASVTERRAFKNNVGRTLPHGKSETTSCELHYLWKYFIYLNTS